MANYVATHTGTLTNMVYNIKVGNKNAELDMDVLLSAAGSAILAEAATITDGANDGTAITLYNKNRRSGESAVATTFHTPTIGTPGTNIFWYNMNSGVTNGVMSSGGTAPGVALKKNTKYTLTFTVASGTQNIKLKIKD